MRLEVQISYLKVEEMEKAVVAAQIESPGQNKTDDSLSKSTPFGRIKNPGGCRFFM